MTSRVTGEERGPVRLDDEKGTYDLITFHPSHRRYEVRRDNGTRTKGRKVGGVKWSEEMYDTVRQMMGTR